MHMAVMRRVQTKTLISNYAFKFFANKALFIRGSYKFSFYFGCIGITIDRNIGFPFEFRIVLVIYDFR